MFPASGAGAPQQQATPPPGPSAWAPPTGQPTSPQSPQGFQRPQQQGFAPPQQQGFQPPQQQGFAPGSSQPHQAHPSHPPQAHPNTPPAGYGQPNPYAPQGAAPNQYPPQGAPPNPYGQQPPQPQAYSPHPTPPIGVPAQPGGKKSSKGLIIGLAAAGVAIAGGIVAFVVLRGGGGTAGGGSRDAVVKSTLAAMGAGDVDQLMKLSDIPGLYAKVIDCSGKTKPRKTEDDSDMKDKDDEELSDKDKEDRDPKKQVEKRKKEYEENVPLAKGAKIELVELVTKEPPVPSDDEKKSDDDDSGESSKGFLMKSGSRLYKGCYAKVPMRFHMAKVKLKVTPKGEPAIEQDAEVMLIQVGKGYWLAGTPSVNLGTAALERELKGMKDKVCACADAKCAEKLKDDFKESPRRKEIKKQMKALSEKDKEKIDAIEDEIKACESKLSGGEQLATMIEFKDKICACTNKECADKVTQEMTVWGKSHVDSKLSEGDMKKASEIGEAMGKCIAKLYSDNTGAGIGATIAAAGGSTDFAEIQGIPPSCEDYRQTLMKLSNCSKFPEASRKALADGWKAMTDAWKMTSSNTVPPEAVKAMDDGCKQGADALKQAGTAMGC